MGRVAGGNVIYGRGILRGECPDFIKQEMSKKSLSYLGHPKEQKDNLDILADISLLSIKSKFYLRLMEVCRRDNFTTVRQDGIALSSLLKEVCSTYGEEHLGNNYYILMGKSLSLETLGNTFLFSGEEKSLRDFEMKEQITCCENLVKEILVHIKDIGEESCSVG